MYWDVVDAKITGDLEFRVTFADGLKGRVKMLPSHLQGVFAPLRDPSFFSRLAVTNGYVSWPNEIDLAPDAMHESIRQSGEWILS